MSTCISLQPIFVAFLKSYMIIKTAMRAEVHLCLIYFKKYKFVQMV